jgi:hypothetical protein
MFIVTQHHIHDPVRFWRIAHAVAFRLPVGVALYSLLPSRNRRRATLLWEAEGLSAVQRFVEPLCRDVAETAYYEVDDRFALLPSTTAYAPEAPAPVNPTRTGGLEPTR